jgi:hypothetical protein
VDERGPVEQGGGEEEDEGDGDGFHEVSGFVFRSDWMRSASGGKARAGRGR